MRKFEYTPTGVCAKKITINYTIDSGEPIIVWVEFQGGCPGHSSAVANLCAGRTASNITAILKGITCGNRGTSCPDQLALALEALRNQTKNEQR